MSYNRRAWEKANKPFPRKGKRNDYGPEQHKQREQRLDRKSVKQELRKAA